LNVTGPTFVFATNTTTKFTDYRIIPTYYPAVNNAQISPPDGFLFNVSQDISTGLLVTSTSRLFYSRSTGNLIGTLNAVFFLTTIKQILINANPSKQGGFLAMMQDGMIIVADSAPDSILTQIAPCATNSMMSRGTLNWYVFAALPDSEYYGPVVAFSYNTIYVALGVLIIALIISFVVTLIVLSTLTRLSKSFSHIQQLNLEAKDIKAVLKSRTFVFEIASLRENFKAMLFTLKSFQKYIPKELVLELVSSHQEAKLGLIRKKCTVFFMDVAVSSNLSNQAHISSRVLPA
jgi:methyl-accepting chemotaxis protein